LDRGNCRFFGRFNEAIDSGIEENKYRTIQQGMAMASPHTVIADLRRQLERTKSLVGKTAATLPFGINEIDEWLPVGGLQLGFPAADMPTF
jgi:hypothetical protein